MTTQLKPHHEVHHAECSIPADRIAKHYDGQKNPFEVGLQRDFEPIIRCACGMKVLKCWLNEHWAVCLEMRGKCFYPEHWNDEKKLEVQAKTREIAESLARRLGK